MQSENPALRRLAPKRRLTPFLAVVCGFTGASLFLGASVPLGPVPALGPLFSPFEGFWRNMAYRLPTRDLTLRGPDSEIKVTFDARGVPHVAASSERDLAWAQGYVTARDRLFQMDMQARSAGGRLAEVLGPGLLAHDIARRKRGMVWAAENMLAEVREDPITASTLEAYAAGVNAWIDALAQGDWPLEYKLLGTGPDRWTPLHSALFAKEMARELSGGSDDVRLTNDRVLLGDPGVEVLFPFNEAAKEPVISRDRAWPAPSVAVPAATQMEPPRVVLDPSSDTAVATPAPGNGSNNWAVTAAKSRTGFPILADDPHLGLRLPSIWYEIQLLGPGVNVYGVSLPGLPAVMIGFNDAIAWGVTNGGTDVLDWYRVRFRDADRKEYFHDGAWKPVRMREERVRVKGAPDTVIQVPYTHHGPVAIELREKGAKAGDTEAAWPLAMRWMAHDRSNEFRAFRDLNRARTDADVRAALSGYAVPVQNFAVIGKDGYVGMHHAGRIPLKWRGQGAYVLDGTRAEHDWRGIVPIEENPREENPPRGFVSSANQHPVDGSYPYFMSGEWRPTSSSRAIRVNELLSRAEPFSPEEFVAMHGDVLDVNARRMVPWLLERLDQASVPAGARPVVTDFLTWDYRRHADSRVSTFYERWSKALREKAWRARVPPDSGLAPWMDTTFDLLLSEPNSGWFDDPATPEKETATTLVSSVFGSTWEELSAKHGPYGPAWEWARARGTDLPHLGLVPGMGFKGLATSGANTTINAMQKDHGPSWRMVVTFEADGPRAWGALPGGPSGNPGSPLYDSLVEKWRNTVADPLVYLPNPGAASALAAMAPGRSGYVGGPMHAKVNTFTQALAGVPWWVVPLAFSLVGLFLPGGLAVSFACAGALSAIVWGAQMAERSLHAHPVLLERMGGLLGGAPAAVPVAVALALAILPAGLVAAALRGMRLSLTSRRTTP